MNDLIEVLKSDEIKDISSEYLEILIDDSLHDDTLKSIPIVSTVCSLYKLSKSLSDRSFIKKLIVYFYGIRDVPYSQKVKILDKINRKDFDLEDFIVSVIIRNENIDKTKLLSYIFKEYLFENIDQDYFIRITYIVEKLLWLDIEKMAQINFDNIPEKELQLRDVLISNGLLRIMDAGMVFTDGKPIPATVTPNEIGKEIKRIISGYYKLKSES